ncbi:MAG TPA: tagatose-bisphosphate aldolase [Atopostipes sp.]|nr:tagatose-bisphosphate aldolase [Atopostipes sp.]
MLELSKKKKEGMDRLSADDGFIKALAIDQRGAMNRMFDALGIETSHEEIERLKELVSEELTPYASSILLDPVYGMPATKVRDKDAGLLLAYEKTGYDNTVPGRLPDLIDDLSVKRILDEGADGVKLLVYYDVDESDEINEQKKAFIERVGSECIGEDVPFYLEILTYDANIEDTKSPEYAKVKPHKVNGAIAEFSKPQYNVDVLKMETPVNMNFVEGYSEGEVVHSKEEAAKYFKEQSDATHLPFIFLSAGVTMELFNQTLEFASEAGSKFNGVLCGRATWSGVVEPFAKEGEEAAREWLRTEGKKNIKDLNKVIEQTATPWHDLVEVK